MSAVLASYPDLSIYTHRKSVQRKSTQMKSLQRESEYANTSVDTHRGEYLATVVDFPVQGERPFVDSTVSRSEEKVNSWGVLSKVFGFFAACALSISLGALVSFFIAPSGEEYLSYTTHLVQPGETLSSIADSYAVSEQFSGEGAMKIRELNFLSDDSLRVGQSLLIAR